MFEGLVASILNKWLGKYVQDLDTEQFNIGIFSGEVKLNNLILKPEALFELELPIEVKHGVIGEMSLTIPWSSLSNQAICISIEDIFVVANPVGCGEFDAEAERKLLRAGRKKILDDLDGEGIFGSGNGTLLDGLLSALANNIQLFIKKLHIRYEDRFTSRGVACGVCIQGISVETTNSKWKPCTISAGSATVYQLARLEAIAAYFNTGMEESGYVGSAWKTDMGLGLQNFAVQGKNLDFLIKPFSAKMKIIVSRSTESRVPKLLVDLVVQDVVFQLSRTQLHAIIAVAQLFNRINLRREFLHFRIQTPVSGNAASWWRYSCRAVLQQRVRPYKWESIKNHRENYRQYKSLYKQVAFSPGNTELRLDLGRAEDKLSLSSIVIAREHAKIEIKNENPDQIEIVAEEEKWWSITSGGCSESVKFQIRPDKPRGLWSQLSQTEKLKLKELFGKSEEASAPEKAKKYIEHKINVTLHNFAASLFIRGTEIASLTLSDFLGSFESRPAVKAFKVSARAETFAVEGASIEHGLVPILTIYNASGNSSCNFLSIDFEKNPLTVDADYGITVNLESTEIIYHEYAISEFMSFFHGIGNAENFFKSQCMRLRDNLIYMKNLIDYRQLRISVNMNIEAPHIVIAETGSLQNAGMVTVIDLGKWTLRSDLQPPLCLEDVTQMELEERLYDRLHVNLDGLQILFSDSGDEWRESLKLDDTDYHILSKIRSQIVLSSSIKPDYKLLPRSKLNISIASIKLSLSDRRIMMLLDFMEALPLPSSNTISIAPVITRIELEGDTVKPEPSGKVLKRIKNSVVSAELSRQRTPDCENGKSLALHVAAAEKAWASVDVSDEDVELWARTVDLPGFDDNISPNNVIKSLFRLVLGEIVFLLNRSSDLIDKPYLMTRISKFQLDAAFLLYGPAIQATLGGVQLIDKLHIGPSGGYLELLTTQSDLDFVSVLYRKVRSDCPDFKSYFHSVEQSLVLDVGLLNLNVHRDAILTISKYLQYLYAKVIQKDTWINMPDLNCFKSIFARRKTEEPPIPPGAIKFSYSSHVTEFRMKLCDSECEFAEFKVGGFESDCMFKANERIVLRAYLSKFSLDDISGISIYSKLISVEEEKVFEMKYVRHSPRLYGAGMLGSNQDDVKSDGSLKFNLGKIHVVIFYKMLVDIKNFIVLLVPGGLLHQATDLIRKPIMSQIRQLKGWNTRLHLSLSLHLPVLLIPQKMTSPYMMLFNLGELSVENFFKEIRGFNTSDEIPFVVENLLLKLESAFCSRALVTITGSLDVLEEILEPVHVRLDVKRLVGSSAEAAKTGNVNRCKEIPNIEIFGNMEPVKIAIGQKDLYTFLTVWKYNLSDMKSFEISWPRRSSSSTDAKSPTENDDPLVKKLQAFLSHGDVCRKDTTARFSIDSVMIVLYNDMDEILSSPVRDLSHGFCKLTLSEASFFLEKNYDGSVEVKVALLTCLLEDIRSESSVTIRKVFQSHYRGEGKFDSTISVSTPPIIDVAFKQAQSGDRCVDVLVEKTRLNLSASFLIEFGKFIIESLPAERSEGGIVNHAFIGDFVLKPRISENVNVYKPVSGADSASYYSTPFSSTVEEQSGFSISLQFRKPEIMIFSTGERKTRAILFRCEVLADWSKYPGREAFIVSLASFQVISKSHPANPKTNNETSVVLHQCDVEIARNMRNFDDGTKISAKISPIDVRLSAATLSALSEIFQELHGALSCENGTTRPCINNNHYDVEDLWSPKKIPYYCDTNALIVIGDPPFGEQRSFPVGKPAQILTFSVPKIRVVIEVEYGANRKPLFMLHSSLKFTAHDWSSLLNLKGELELQASYYNQVIGAWEPLVEPLGEAQTSHRPWSLAFQIFQGKSFPISPQTESKKENVTVKSGKATGEEARGEDSETSGDESDEGMTFLRPRNFDSGNERKRQAALENFGDSDSESEDAALEKLTAAVGRLFAGDSEGELSESGDSSASEDVQEDEVETEDETASVRSPAQERAVFLKKHSDSVDSGLETEAVDRLATHVLIHSKERMELVLTPVTLKVMEELHAALSNENQFTFRMDHGSSDIVNSIGPGTVVSLLSKTDSAGAEKTVCAARYEREDSPVSSPDDSECVATLSPTNSDTDTEIFSGVTGPCNGSLTPVLQFPRESLSKLYDRLTANRLLIQVPGFQDLKVVAPKASGNKLHALLPIRNQTRYHVVLTTEYCFGVRRYLVRGPFQVRNETTYAMGIFYRKSIIESIGEKIVGETTNPFEDMTRLAVVEPDEILNVPLFVAYHCKLHVLPAHVNSYEISEAGLFWQDMISDVAAAKDICCASKQKNDPTVFVIRAICEETGLQRTPRSLPNCVVRLVPPLAIHNYLSYALQVKLPNAEHDIRVEAGDKTNVYFLNLQKAQRIMLEVPEYLGISWSGSLNLTPDMEEKILIMSTEQDTEGGNKQLALNICIRRNPTANLYVHSPYWIINKTGLPLQLRGSTSDFIHEWTGEGPLLFCYRKQRRHFVRLRAFTSSWSSAFSLDTPGCPGLVICKDKERKRLYRILAKSHLSQLCPELTKIVTFLPNFIVTNDSRKHLRFMEDNERADLWIDITPGQCLPFWPETDSMRMFVKFRDSKHISQHFPVTTAHVTVLRMDKGCGLTVEVAGGSDEPFSIRFRNYTSGDAPIRIDNQCEDLFLKFHQKELNQVALLSPYQSLLYTWDDPSKGRTLVWNVYNNKGAEFCVPLWKDGFGEERISFHMIRQGQSGTGNSDRASSKLSSGFKKFNVKSHAADESSTSDDSDDESQKPQLGKKIRRDKVIVYWASYIENRQRVLLLTQDEKTARRVRRSIDAERSHLELFVSINGIGLSLICNDDQGKLRELSYLSLSDSAPCWEVMVAHRWKPLALELAALLEERFNQGLNKTQIKDYIHIDFEKMQMTKPFFGELKRRHKPAVWIQYRRSMHMSLMHTQIHRVQIDNGIHDAQFPTVLYPVACPPNVWKHGCKPAFEVALLKKHSPQCAEVYKFGKIIVQEHCIQLEKSWLCEMYKFYSSWCKEENPVLRMRQDIALIHLPISGIVPKSSAGNSDENVIEYLHCSPIKLQINFSPQNGCETIDFFQFPYISYIMSIFASSLAQTKSITVKLLYYEMDGQMCSSETLWPKIIGHYRTQFLQQLHVLAMGINVLTNPYSGFLDFHEDSHHRFYEPSIANIGIPEEFSEGLSVGALGFLGHEIGGPAGATSLLAASLGTALQHVIQHEDSARKRMPRAEGSMPETAGVASNFAIASSLGLSGVMMKPNHGNGPLQGVETFFRGPGKNLMGLMSRSNCGSLNCLSMATYGVRRASEMGESIIMRIRPPHHVDSILGLRPYSGHDARGVALQKSLCRGHYNKDTYWNHAPLTDDPKTIILITLEHIFLVEKNRLWGNYEPIWMICVDDLLTVPSVENNKLMFSVRQEQNINSFWNEEKSVCSHDEVLLQWLKNQVEMVLVLNMEGSLDLSSVSKLLSPAQHKNIRHQTSTRRAEGFVLCKKFTSKP